MTTTALLANLLATVPDAVRAPGDAIVLPPDYSNHVDSVDWPFWFITWVSIFFFVLVVALMVYFGVRYRRTGHGKSDPTAPTHHTALEVTWSGIPLVLVIMMFYVGFKGFMNLANPPADAKRIDVAAKKWDWLFTYANGWAEPELHVVAGEPVELVMSSQDVIHSFYVPDFRVKNDVVPGRFSRVWFIPVHSGETDRPEWHHLFCAEYCGTNHSDMISRVVVHPTQESFDTWLANVSAIHDQGWAPATVGRVLVEKRGCYSCHTTDGTTLIGPSFLDTWDRAVDQAVTFGDGTQLDLDDYGGLADNYIAESIRDPQAKIVQGYPASMPSFKGQLDDRDISAIIAFLRYLSENGEVPPPPPQQ